MTTVLDGLVCFFVKKLLLCSAITLKVNEAKIQKCQNGLFTITCLNVIDVSQDSWFRNSSCVVKEIASLLTIFKEK